MADISPSGEYDEIRILGDQQKQMYRRYHRQTVEFHGWPNVVGRSSKSGIARLSLRKIHFPETFPFTFSSRELRELSTVMTKSESAREVVASRHSGDK